MKRREEGEAPKKSKRTQRSPQEASRKSPRSLQETPKKRPKGRTTTGVSCFCFPLGDLRRSANHVEVGHGGAHD